MDDDDTINKKKKKKETYHIKTGGSQYSSSKLQDKKNYAQNIYNFQCRAS